MTLPILRSGKNNAKWPLVCSNTASAVKTLELGDPLFTWRFRLSDHNGDHLAKEADLWSRWLLLLCIGIAACLQQEKEDGLEELLLQLFYDHRHTTLGHHHQGQHLQQRR